MGFLLDTDILSGSSNPRPNRQITEWMDQHDHELFLSTISMGEITKGIELLPPGKRRKSIETWFLRLERWAGLRLLTPDEKVMREWGKLCAYNEREGRRLPVLDSIIAATAIAHGHTLVTRNTSDHPSEVPILNPWVCH